MGAYLVRCTGVDKDENGKVVAIHAEADLETRNGNPADGRKVRGTIHWVSCATAWTPRSSCMISCSPRPT